MDLTSITEAIMAFYDGNHRDLPWRHTKDPYRILLSEVMLQQTRAETVISYYERFLSKFPTVRDLAAADEQDVLKCWEGLGYYSRARNLQASAKKIVDDYGGVMPQTADELVKLPGIGVYTAGAIASIAFSQPVAAVDGNVSRVISRLFAIHEDITRPEVKRQIHAHAQQLVPAIDAGRFTNAIIELGAVVCTPKNPLCGSCPIARACKAFAAGDAAQLPIKKKLKAQRVERRSIALLFHKDRTLVVKRKEKLLNGLWVFPDFLDMESPREIAQALGKQGIDVVYDAHMGSAKHIFTHIIWEMEIHTFYVAQQVAIDGGVWVDSTALRALPMPTAVSAARSIARQLLEQEIDR